MRREIITLMVLPIIMLGSAVARAQGTAGFEILRLQTFPRGSALGGALVADAGQIEALYYNPAGLRALTARTAAAGYMNYLMDVNSGYLAYVEPQRYWGTWGLNLVYINYGDFDRRDNAGVDLGSFSASDVVFGATYANDIQSRIYFGGSGKFAYSKIENYNGSALAFDLGAQYQLLEDRLRLGAGLYNVGWTTKSYVNTRDDLPLYYRLGISGRPEGLPASLYFSMTLYQEYADNYSLSGLSGSSFMDFLGEIYYGVGAEFKPMESFYLRVGYDTQGLDQRVGTGKDAFAGISGGFGLDLTIARVDFGLASYGELGLVHRTALSVGF